LRWQENWRKETAEEVTLGYCPMEKSVGLFFSVLRFQNIYSTTYIFYTSEIKKNFFCSRVKYRGRAIYYFILEY